MTNIVTTAFVLRLCVFVASDLWFDLGGLLFATRRIAELFGWLAFWC